VKAILCVDLIGGGYEEPARHGVGGLSHGESNRGNFCSSFEKIRWDGGNHAEPKRHGIR
jgi:hypothetical protein